MECPGLGWLKIHGDNPVHSSERALVSFGVASGGLEEEASLSITRMSKSWRGESDTGGEDSWVAVRTIAGPPVLEDVGTLLSQKMRVHS